MFCVDDGEGYARDLAYQNSGFGVVYIGIKILGDSFAKVFCFADINQIVGGVEVLVNSWAVWDIGNNGFFEFLVIGHVVKNKIRQRKHLLFGMLALLLCQKL